MKRFVCANQNLLVDYAVQISIVTDFVSSSSVSLWEMNVQIYHCNCGFIFLLQLHQFLLHVFWGSVVLEKTLESPLDCKEIKPVNPKGDQQMLTFCFCHICSQPSSLISFSLSFFPECLFPSFLLFRLGESEMKVKVLVAQFRLTVCNPMDCNPPDSSVHGILQARILEWVAIPFFRESSKPRDWMWVSCICKKILYCMSHQGSPQIRWIPLLFAQVHWLYPSSSPFYYWEHQWNFLQISVIVFFSL